MTFRILVTGSRTWTDEQTVRDALRSVYRPDAVLVHGGAQGADSIAHRIWTAAGLPTEVHPVLPQDWKRLGRKAGPLRNQHMVSLGADIVLAFQKDNSRGTQSTIDFARSAGLKVEVYTS